MRGIRLQRPWWLFWAWVVAAWQVSIGWVLGLPFAYGLAGAVAIAVVAWLVRDPLDWLIAVTLLPRETPGLQLSAQGTSRLGRSSWLRSRSEQTVLVVDPLHPERTAAA